MYTESLIYLKYIATATATAHTTASSSPRPPNQSSGSTAILGSGNTGTRGSTQAGVLSSPSPISDSEYDVTEGANPQSAGTWTHSNPDVPILILLSILWTELRLVFGRIQFYSLVRLWFFFMKFWTKFTLEQTIRKRLTNQFHCGHFTSFN